MTNYINDDNNQPDPRDLPPARLPNGKFGPGFCGNRKGRPRKPKGRQMLPRIEDLHNVLSTEMLKEHEYTQNGEKKTMAFIVLLIRRMKVDALKGDKWSTRQLLEWWKDILKSQYDQKMDFFQAVRDAELLNFFELLELNEKM